MWVSQNPVTVNVVLSNDIVKHLLQEKKAKITGDIIAGTCYFEYVTDFSELNLCMKLQKFFDSMKINNWLICRNIIDFGYKITLQTETHPIWICIMEGMISI